MIHEAITSFFFKISHDFSFLIAIETRALRKSSRRAIQNRESRKVPLIVSSIYGCLSLSAETQFAQPGGKGASITRGV
jgi:hypothetical protein